MVSVLLTLAKLRKMESHILEQFFLIVCISCNKNYVMRLQGGVSLLPHEF